ncbi:MAG: tripartite tricarboxylate transporter substrate binding protein, partial [Xanthobacteraceae bacterium]
MRKLSGAVGLTRRSWLRGGSAAAISLAASSVISRAADWPNRRATIIVPYAAGGLSDLLARLCGQILSEKFGQPFIVENRPGGGGIVAALTVANAAPDGYTLLLSPPGPIVIVPMIETVTYDPDRFAPISTVEHAPLLFAIKSSLPVKTLADFIAYAKANPGKLNYSSGGIGAVTHLLAALFASRAGLDIVHVPYKGTIQAIFALLSSEVDMFFSTSSEMIPYLSDDRIRILATSSSKRLSALPEIPAIGEMFPGFSLDPWNGLLATPGTPRNIVDKIAEALISASKAPWMLDQLAKLGVLPG